MARNAVRIPSVVRCMVWKEKSQWFACTLEFGLACQGSSMAEAKTKLEAQLREYVDTALHEDPKFGAELMARRAPFWAYVMWSVYRFASWRRGRQQGQAFTEPVLPLAAA